MRRSKTRGSLCLQSDPVVWIGAVFVSLWLRWLLSGAGGWFAVNYGCFRCYKLWGMSCKYWYGYVDMRDRL